MTMLGSLLCILALLGLVTPLAGAAKRRYDLISGEDMRSASVRNYRLVVVKGHARQSFMARWPRKRFINYEQGAGLNRREARHARRRGWLAETCRGKEIHPQEIPDITLLDLTKRRARRWRIRRVARETKEGGYDGSYLDTLGAYYPRDHYTGRPCGLTDRRWRRASVRSLRALRRRTHTPVIANGAGLGSGSKYFKRRQVADALIRAADGVQIEHFGRNDPQDDTAYLRVLRRRHKLGLAKCHAKRMTCLRAFRNAGDSRRLLLNLD